MWRRLWLNLERRVLYHAIRLTRIRGASEKVARGFALGLVVNFYPTFGLGVLISGFVARILGGNFVAGTVGGALISLFWPLLFYLNIRVGGWFYQAPLPVEELEDVTEKTVDALVWGQTFTVGAVFNSLWVGLLVYLLLRLLYRKTRPMALAYFRHHARDHQRRLGRRHRHRPAALKPSGLG